jgi:hypothetical protein
MPKEEARETLEARERAKEYAVISLLKERPKMKEEVLNTRQRRPQPQDRGNDRA